MIQNKPTLLIQLSLTRPSISFKSHGFLHLNDIHVVNSSKCISSPDVCSEQDILDRNCNLGNASSILFCTLQYVQNQSSARHIVDTKEIFVERVNEWLSYRPIHLIIYWTGPPQGPTNTWSSTYFNREVFISTALCSKLPFSSFLSSRIRTCSAWLPRSGTWAPCLISSFRSHHI